MLLGNISIHLPKNEKGQFFPNLGMLTTLLPKKPSKGVIQPIVEVLDQEKVGSLEDENHEDDEELDWSMEQVLPSQQVSCPWVISKPSIHH